MRCARFFSLFFLEQELFIFRYLLGWRQHFRKLTLNKVDGMRVICLEVTLHVILVSFSSSSSFIWQLFFLSLLSILRKQENTILNFGSSNVIDIVQATSETDYELSNTEKLCDDSRFQYCFVV